MSPLPRGEPLAELVGGARRGVLDRIVCRLGHGRHHCPPEGRLTRELGLVGDRWSEFNSARRPGEARLPGGCDPVIARQLTVMDVRVVRALLAHARTRPGAQLTMLDDDALDRPGDNLVVDWPTSVAAMPPGTRLRVGTAIIEANDLPHMGCKKFEERFGPDALAWVNDGAHRALRLRGINAFVVEDGEVRVGDAVEVVGPPGLGPT